MLVGVVVLAASSFCFAQDAPDDLARSLVDLKQRLEKDESVVDPLRTEISAQIQNAEANLTKIEELNKRTDADLEAAKTAVKRSAEFLSELEKLQRTVPLPPSPDLPLADIDAEAAVLKTKVERIKQDLVKNEQESGRRGRRRSEIRLQLDELEKLASETQEKIQALSTTDNSLTTQAMRIQQQSLQRLVEVERVALFAEQDRYEAAETVNILRSERDLLNLQLTQSQTRLTAMETLQATKRQQIARQSAEAAAKEQAVIQDRNPLLANSYEKNTKLAERVQAIEARASKAKKQLDLIIEQETTLNEDFKDTKKRIKTIGLTGAIGAMLRKRKLELPSVRRSISVAEDIKNEMNDVQYESFDIAKQREELSPGLIRAEIEAEYGRQDEATFDRLEKPINELIAARKEKLDAVKDSLERLFENYLKEIEYKERVLIKETTTFREYINERILWIRSNDVLFSKIEIDSTDELIFDPASWKNAGQRVWQVISRNPAAFGLPVFFILVLWGLKPKMRREVDRLGQVASRGACDSFWPTAHALVLTLMIALTAPLFLLVFGLLLSRTTFPDSPLFDALGPALLSVAWFSIPFEILRRICRRNGLANQHFDWPDSSVEKLRNNLGQIIIPGAVVVFFIALLRELDQTHRVDLLERSLFVLVMLGFTYFSWKTFHPNYGIFDEYLKNNERSWANQLSALWFGAIVAIPLSLAILAFFGFYYTAINLAECAYATFIFAVVVEAIRALLKRLVLVQRRHVHIQTARRKNEARLRARAEQKKAQAEAEAAGLVLTESELTPAAAANFAADSMLDIRPDLDIDENAQQAVKLVSLSMVLIWAIGLWMIWSDVLPALKALDSYTLWPTSIVENGIEPKPAEAAVPDTKGPALPPGTPGAGVPSSSIAETSSAVEDSQVGRVTVRNLLLFIVISIVTLISTRNLPSALEMLLLDHLPVDRSFRFALKSLFSYAIVMVGMILAFRALSITWSSVQWLATALTFGLAFGLQEIFANFVAGIILMFERPIRIGDWITVDEFTGIVTKIRTRATTIVNWDRKEYVIPNKDFITGRLVNWTLSDAINRIVINVGIAYGSDVEKAKQILYDICRQHPKTLDDPATFVQFESFGESSLNLVARTFLGDVDCRIAVIDELNSQINSAFNQAGIVISFPQRDLHICSIDGQAVESIRGRQTTNGKPDLSKGELSSTQK